MLRRSPRRAATGDVMTEPTLTDDEMERIPLRARLANLRDDIRSTPMLHQADAVARERWGEALSTLVNELLLVDEALSTLVNELLLVDEALSTLVNELLLVEEAAL